MTSRDAKGKTRPVQCTGKQKGSAQGKRGGILSDEVPGMEYSPSLRIHLPAK